MMKEQKWKSIFVYKGNRKKKLSGWGFVLRSADNDKDVL